MTGTVFSGAVIAAGQGRISGWCSGAPAFVSIYRGEYLVGTTPVDSKFTETPDRHAFTYSVPAHLHDGETHEFSVFAGAGMAELEGSPVCLELRQAARSFEGVVDMVVGTVASGWARNWLIPEEPPLVHIMENGTIIASGRGESRTPSGAWRFAIRLPESLFDGKAHRLTAAAGSEQVEIGAPLDVVTNPFDLERAYFHNRVAAAASRIEALEEQIASLTRAGGQSLSSNRIAEALARLILIAELNPGGVAVPPSVLDGLLDASRELTALVPELGRFGQNAGDDAPLLQRVQTRFPPLAFTPCANPTVSLVIPVFNQFSYTYKCLESILRNPPEATYDIILVDDCSSDETLLAKWLIHGINIFRQEVNGGFIESCNRGASLARGKYVMFLNNDTTLMPGAVDALVKTFALGNVGLAGSKLVYPDGKLQEAGGIVWRDGSAWNYGRLANADGCDYDYVRPVDYVSGASIMLPKSLWNEIGGFDPLYKPAYYEDTDLAFKVRARGLQVLYQPHSVVVHHEGVTSGRDLKSGIKAYQTRNAKLFQERWKNVLASHRPNGVEPLLERDRGVTKRLLVIDAVTPEPDKDAGSVVCFEQMRIFQSLGFKVTFVPADNFAYVPAYTKALQALGIEAIYHPTWSNIETFMTARAREFDLVYIHRFEIAERCLSSVRRHQPDAPVLFNNADLHYLRMMRGAELKGDPREIERVLDVKERELAVIRAVDCTILCSTAEMDIVKSEAPEARLHYFPWVLNTAPLPRPDYQARQGFMFLGGFGHPPNVDAVLYFVREIMPLVRPLLPGVRFTIYGSKLPEEIERLAAPDIIVAGFAPDLGAVFDRHRVSVVPLRYGAGFKGKLAASLAHGVPAVVSAIGAEGTGLNDGNEILVRDDPRGFAEALAKLYGDRAQWEAMSERGWHYVEENFSVARGRQRFIDVLTRLGRPDLIAAPGIVEIEALRRQA